MSDGKFTVVKSLRPNSKGGHDYAAVDEKQNIIAEFFYVIGIDERKDFIQSPAEKYANLFVDALNKAGG